MKDNETKDINLKFNFSYTAILGIAFIILKLCKVINWAWVWVLAPFWVGAALALIIFLVAIIIIAIKDRY